jgi:predicted RNase H-like HicB family nuclease
MTLSLHVENASVPGLLVTCEEFPDAVAYGIDMDEAVANLAAGIRAMLEEQDARTQHACEGVLSAL